MERFVIGAAIVAAVAIAAGGYFGHAVSGGDGFRFEIDGGHGGGGGRADLKGPGAPTAVPAKAYGGNALAVRNAVAVLKVIPEDRADIVVEIANPGLIATPTVRLDGDRVIVDGGVAERRIGDCRTQDGAFAVEVRGVGVVNEAQAPVVTARVPRAVRLATSGAVETTVGPSASAELAFAGCGDATVADTAGRLELDASGSGDTAAGAAGGGATVSVAGSGDTALGAVTGALEVSIAGSGEVTAARAQGPLDVDIAGSGGVAVNGGAIGDADVSIAGSGDVTLAANVQKLDVSIAGSGNVDVRGSAAAVDASIMGSGDVTVASVQGAVEKSVMGSGSVMVGRP